MSDFPSVASVQSVVKELCGKILFITKTSQFVMKNLRITIFSQFRLRISAPSDLSWRPSFILVLDRDNQSAIPLFP